MYQSDMADAPCDGHILFRLRWRNDDILQAHFGRARDQLFSLGTRPDKEKPNSWVFHQRGGVQDILETMRHAQSAQVSNNEMIRRDAESRCEAVVRVARRIASKINAVDHY